MATESGDTLPPGTEVLVGLGGNLGDEAEVAARFAAATAAFESRLAVGPVDVSAVYRTAPVGAIRDQPRFLNAVARFALARAMSPRALLHEILAIERELGRVRHPGQPRGGPRTIDLDLLFAGDAVADEPGLSLPHPRAAERAFVLRPLADLLGVDWPLPGADRTVGECLHAVLSPADEAGDVRPVSDDDERGGGDSQGEDRVRRAGDP